MLTRSKIKMEESFKEIHQNLPSYAHDETPYYNMQSIKQVQSGNINTHQPQYTAYRTSFTEESRPGAARNDILKELRQEYEILRNISIEESQHVPMKQLQQKSPHYQEPSQDLSSSLASKSSRNHKSRPPRQSNREVETLHLQKKQLQLVIGNSMRKIQELLNNQITLKKTIHELKTQIDGKGGISLQYEKTIKNLQKNEEELQGQMSRIKHENDKNVQRIREMTQKVRSLESELDSKDRQVKQGFEEQRRFHELIRIEKDKFLNIQIQCRSLKMELEMSQKEKNNDINRLIREYQSREGQGDKEMSYRVRKLEQELRQKDKRYYDLMMEKETTRIRKESEVVPLEKKDNKNYLDDILQKSKSMNQNSNKAITDGMNMIFTKMSELQRRNEETMKRQIQEIRKRMEGDGKKKVEVVVEPNREKENELLDRIAELQEIIRREVNEKNKLAEDIQNQQDHKSQLYTQNQRHQFRIKELQLRQANLVEEISALETLRQDYENTLSDYTNLRAEHEVYIQRLNQYQRQHEKSRGAVDGEKVREKQKRYEEEIRLLKRRVDEAEFEAEKSKKEGEFNFSMFKTTQESEIKRITSEKTRVSQKYSETESRLNQVQRQLDTKVKSKDAQINDQRAAIESMNIKSQEDLISQKRNYEEKISFIQSRHTHELKSINEKFMALTMANEKMVTQIGHMGMLESEGIELRRLLRTMRTNGAGMDHLWSIKEAEYENINEIIRGLRAA